MEQEELTVKWREIAIDFTRLGRDKGYKVEDCFMAAMIMVSSFAAMKKIPLDVMTELINVLMKSFRRIEDDEV